MYFEIDWQEDSHKPTIFSNLHKEIWVIYAKSYFRNRNFSAAFLEIMMGKIVGKFFKVTIAVHFSL